MYKHASRNLQRRHCVDKPLPTGGMIGLGVVEDDFIPSAGNMGFEECRDELRRLGVELTRAQNEMIVVKRSNATAAISELGLRIQGLCSRRSVIKTRLQTLWAEERRNDPSETLAEAIREVAPAVLQTAIFRRARQLNKAKSG
jgi:hypothetical protein